MINRFRFRGKRIGDRDWVHGILVNNNKCHERWLINVIGGGVYLVNEHTISQHTGLKDKDKADVFEGDILEDSHKNRRTVFAVPGGFAIEGSPDAFGYGYQDGNNVFESIADLQTKTWIEDSCRVIGNIYDNKNLLK